MNYDFFTPTMRGSGRAIFLCLVCLFVLLPLLKGQSTDQQDLEKEVRKALGAKKRAALKNISFKVTTQQGEMIQEAQVVIQGKDRAAVMLTEQADSMVYVRNGESYFARTRHGILDLESIQLQNQIDAYLTWVDLLGAIKWDGNTLEKEKLRQSGKTYLVVRQGKDELMKELWIDSETKLPFRLKQFATYRGQQYPMTIEVTAYQKFHGVALPVALVVLHETAAGNYQTNQQISNIRFDSRLSKKLFQAVKTQ